MAETEAVFFWSAIDTDIDRIGLDGPIMISSHYEAVPVNGQLSTVPATVGVYFSLAAVMELWPLGLADRGWHIRDATIKLNAQGGERFAKTHAVAKYLGMARPGNNRTGSSSSMVAPGRWPPGLPSSAQARHELRYGGLL
jgi:hypothetical protein